MCPSHDHKVTKPLQFPVVSLLFFLSFIAAASFLLWTSSSSPSSPSLTCLPSLSLYLCFTMSLALIPAPPHPTHLTHSPSCWQVINEHESTRGVEASPAWISNGVGLKKEGYGMEGGREGGGGVPPKHHSTKKWTTGCHIQPECGLVAQSCGASGRGDITVNDISSLRSRRWLTAHYEISEGRARSRRGKRRRRAHWFQAHLLQRYFEPWVRFALRRQVGPAVNY